MSAPSPEQLLINAEEELLRELTLEWLREEAQQLLGTNRRAMREVASFVLACLREGDEVIVGNLARHRGVKHSNASRPLAEFHALMRGRLEARIEEWRGERKRGVRAI